MKKATNKSEKGAKSVFTGNLRIPGTIEETGVDLTGGTGISIDSETNTTSGDYSSTITCNLEGTELKSTGETGGSKFLREDGDGTCSWQTVSGGGVSDIDDLGDVSFGGTNLTKTLLINNAPGSAPTTGTLGSDCSYNLNLAIGDTALNSITDATYNVALGSNALTALTTGDYNIGIGYNAGAVTTTGHKNVMVGFEAGKNVASSSGESNVALGTSALTGHASSFTGSYNFAVGYSSMEDTTTGSYNIAFGYEALKTITEGDKNIAIGFQVGNNHTTSDSMLYIGNAQPSSDGTLIKGDMANKFLAVGKADVTLSTEDATLQVYPLNTNDSAYFAKMPGSHTGDLIRIENSSGTALFKVDKDGDLTTNSITISESPVVPYTAITGDTTVTTSNVVVFANATSGAIDVTMYTADSNGGRTLTVKKTDSSTNAVSILRAGSDTIDGATSVILYNQNESVTLISDNSNWFII